MKLAIIVAMDRNRGIGRNNDLLWHLPNDLKFFKTQTMGQVVIMGRKNWESIPEKFRPLPGRENVILSRNQGFTAAGCQVFHSLEACLNSYAQLKDQTLFIIGGGEIYKQALDSGKVTEMYITHVDKAYEADTFFPNFPLSEWQVDEVMQQVADEKHEASYVVKHYVKK